MFEAGKCSGHIEPLPGTWEVSFFDCDRDGQGADPTGKEMGGQDGFYVTAKGACVRACACVRLDGRKGR